MKNKNYILRYLPLFEYDLLEATGYISNVLKNTQSALQLVNAVELAILERLHAPTSFEPYHSTKKRTNQYYCIYVKNYTIFYVVIDNVMEVRRFLYSARNMKKHL